MPRHDERLSGAVEVFRAPHVNPTSAGQGTRKTGTRTGANLYSRRGAVRMREVAGEHAQFSCDSFQNWRPQNSFKLAAPHSLVYMRCTIL